MKQRSSERELVGAMGEGELLGRGSESSIWRREVGSPVNHQSGEENRLRPQPPSSRRTASLVASARAEMKRHRRI
ncbi:unnamed protein product [Linum trigynum]|uniref:Uncharacterized protein n=1 Tax=Linum trigynum TaxID=586398 RepID=A0AAV2D7R8_9ROSI